MKPNKKPDSKTIEHNKKIKDFFSHDEIIHLLMTIFGASDLMAHFVFDKAQEFIELPVDVKYGLIQHASVFRLLGSILRDEVKKDNLKMVHMPIGKDAWKTEEDFEKRFILLVKRFYEDLKEEGKL